MIRKEGSGNGHLSPHGHVVETGGGPHTPCTLKDSLRMATVMERLSLSVGALQGKPGGRAPLLGTLKDT